MDGKIWANSGDSHLTEPGDLFEKNLPAGMAERMPRSVKDDDGSHETVYVDGQSFRRRMPRVPPSARASCCALSKLCERAFTYSSLVRVPSPLVSSFLKRASAFAGLIPW